MSTISTFSETVTVSSSTAFIEQQSDIKNNKFVFAYKITISNSSDQAVQLLSRHWIITDAVSYTHLTLPTKA